MYTCVVRFPFELIFIEIYSSEQNNSTNRSKCDGSTFTSKSVVTHGVKGSWSFERCPFQATILMPPEIQETLGVNSAGDLALLKAKLRHGERTQRGAEHG